MDIFLWR